MKRNLKWGRWYCILHWLSSSYRASVCLVLLHWPHKKNQRNWYQKDHGSKHWKYCKLDVDAVFKLVVIAFVIATPLSYFSINNILQNLPYRVEIGADIFAYTLASTILLAFATSSYQAIKTALMNPVKSLRSEWTINNRMMNNRTCNLTPIT